MKEFLDGVRESLRGTGLVMKASRPFPKVPKYIEHTIASPSGDQRYVIVDNGAHPDHMELRLDIRARQDDPGTFDNIFGFMSAPAYKPGFRVYQRNDPDGAIYEELQLGAVDDTIYRQFMLYIESTTFFPNRRPVRVGTQIIGEENLIDLIDRGFYRSTEIDYALEHLAFEATLGAFVDRFNNARHLDFSRLPLVYKPTHESQAHLVTA